MSALVERGLAKLAHVRNECAHESFAVDAVVTRLSDTDTGPVTGYCVDLKVRCENCGQQFFPTVNVDGTDMCRS